MQLVSKDDEQYICDRCYGEFIYREEIVQIDVNGSEVTTVAQQEEFDKQFCTECYKIFLNHRTCAVFW